MEEMERRGGGGVQREEEVGVRERRRCGQREEEVGVRERRRWSSERGGGGVQREEEVEFRERRRWGSERGGGGGQREEEVGFRGERRTMKLVVRRVSRNSYQHKRAYGSHDSESIQCALKSVSIQY